jgi:hypothetical protein
MSLRRDPHEVTCYEEKLPHDVRSAAIWLNAAAIRRLSRASRPEGQYFL